MALTRRQFLTYLGGSAAAAVIFEACGVPEDELLVQGSIEMPEDLVSGLDNWYATLCRQCPTSDGIVVRVMEGRAKKIEGNVDYPINRGKHSARCEAGLQALYGPDRISGPLLRTGPRGAGQWDEISWTSGISRLVDQLQRVQNGAGIVMATDPVSSHLGTVVERFVSTLGARHMAYETLERTTLRAAIKHVFDQDVMPDFDIENTNYLLSFGADFLNTWVSPVRYARGYGHFRQGKQPRGTMVHVDSRFSMTGANADKWVYVNPGWEGVLALSMAQVISGDAELSGFAPANVASSVGVDAHDIEKVADEFAATENQPSLAIGGGSTAAHTNGLFNLSAIYSLNHLVGSVGKPGGVILNPPPVTGKPAKAASFKEWRELTTEMEQGEIKALLLRGADPVYGLPEAVGFGRALDNVPLIVSFSGHFDDTTAMADLILPEHNYLEDWGSDVPDPGPGYETLGFQQPVVRPFFEARGAHLGTKNFPDMLLATMQIMEQGKDLEKEIARETFRDVLQDSARRLFEQNRGSVRSSGFQSFWNGVLQRGGWWDTEARYAGPTPQQPPNPTAIVAPDFEGPEDRDSYHLIPFASTSLTDGRGAHLPWLQATPDPITTATWRTWVEINLKVAEREDIKEGDVLRVVSTATGKSIEAIAYPHPGISPDVVSVPVGQGHAAGGRYSKDRGSNVLSMLDPVENDAGALAWAGTRVKLEKTGRWLRLPRFENTAPDLAVDEGQKVIQITPIDT